MAVEQANERAHTALLDRQRFAFGVAGPNDHVKLRNVPTLIRLLVSFLLEAAAAALVVVQWHFH
jgi:hypothetical protein